MPSSNRFVSRRNFVTGAALLAASGIAFARQPKVVRPRLPSDAVDKMIPKQIGNWAFETSSGLVLPPSDAMSDRLYDEIVTRVYVQENREPIMLLVAYSNLQDGMLQVHRPETCYPVGGFKLSDSQIVNVPVLPSVDIPSRYFSAENVARTEQVLYWTRIGGLFPERWFSQRWAVVDANLRGEIPDGILVRFSTVEPDATVALAHLKEFAAEVVKSLTPKGRQLFVGV